MLPAESKNTMKKYLAAVSILATLTGTVAWAAENLPATLMTQRGKLLYSVDLNKEDKAWRAAKGKWEIVDGGLKGAELKSDNHPAVTRHQLAFKDVVIQFDVQINGAKMATFSINDAKEHMARMLFNKDGFTAQKDDHDHDGPDKAVVFGRVGLPLKPGVWKTALIEIHGDEMVATVDGKSVAGSDPLIATAKANIGFTVAGETASFRNLRIWEATPNPNWAANKAKIPKKK